MKAGFRAGIYADAPPPIFDLRDIHIEHVNLLVHAGPYGYCGDGVCDGNESCPADCNGPATPATKVRIGYNVTARIDDVNVDVGPDAKHDTYIYMDATDPLVAKFYVRLAAPRSTAHVRIFDDGPRSAFHIPATPDEAYPPPNRDEADYELELTDIELTRLAQLPTDWAQQGLRREHARARPRPRTRCRATTSTTGSHPDPKDGADLSSRASSRTTGTARTTARGTSTLDVKNLGPTLHTCIKSKIGRRQPRRHGHADRSVHRVAEGRRSISRTSTTTSRSRPTRIRCTLTLAEVHG